MQTKTNNIQEKYNKLIENKNFLNNQNYVIFNWVDKTSKSYGFYFIDGKIVVLNIFSNKDDKFIPIPRIPELIILIMIWLILLTLISIYNFILFFYK